jgi:hypothetical protein
MKTIDKLLIAAVIVISLSGCVTAGPSSSYAPVDPHVSHYPYDYYDYYYYPAVNVYFDVHRQVYFCYVSGGWVMYRTLPPHIHLHGHAHHKIRMREDRPYLRHREHVREFPRHHYRSDPNKPSHRADKHPGNDRPKDRLGPPYPTREHRKERDSAELRPREKAGVQKQKHQQALEQKREHAVQRRDDAKEKAQTNQQGRQDRRRQDTDDRQNWRR